MNDIYAEVWGERQRQVVKWGEEDARIRKEGSSRAYLLTKISVLGEEFGEACMARNDGDIANLRTELIQVAAVAIATVEGIDLLGAQIRAAHAEATT